MKKVNVVPRAKRSVLVGMVAVVMVGVGIGANSGCNVAGVCPSGGVQCGNGCMPAGNVCCDGAGDSCPPTYLCGPGNACIPPNPCNGCWERVLECCDNSDGTVDCASPGRVCCGNHRSCPGGTSCVNNGTACQ